MKFPKISKPNMRVTVQRGEKNNKLRVLLLSPVLIILIALTVLSLSGDKIPSFESPTMQIEQKPVQNAPTSDQRTYTVKSGDTLFTLAEKFYGDPLEWYTIQEANLGTILFNAKGEQTLITPGMVLVIP